MDCPYCLSTQFYSSFSVLEMTNGTKQPFMYAECAKCKSIVMIESPNNLSSFYENYYSFVSKFSELNTNKLKKIIASMIKFFLVRTNVLILFKRIFKCPPVFLMNHFDWNLQSFFYACPHYDFQIIDIGSGAGELVEVIKKFGFINILGIDPFLPKSQETLFNKKMDITEIKKLASFDLVMFNHTFEHTNNPGEQLMCAAALIKPNGKIIIHIPNLESPERVKYKENWYHYHAPYHYSIPSRQGLEAMATRCGLEIDDIICTSRWDNYLYSQEYTMGISDNDSRSIRRRLATKNINLNYRFNLQKKARALNKQNLGEYISYYLVKPCANKQGDHANR